MIPTHPWKARLGVGLVMLILAFIGIVITDVYATGGWDYWRWVIPIYAVLALWLSWYVKRQTQTISPITLGHELLHWIGVILAVFLVTLYVDLGTVSRFAAGIFNLTILALGVFLAGIYIERTFLLIGTVLGVFAGLSAFIVQYLYAFLVPILIASAIIAVFMAKLLRHPYDAPK